MRTACEFQESSAKKWIYNVFRQGGNILWRVARISVMGKVRPVPASLLWRTTGRMSWQPQPNTAAAILVYGQPQSSSSLFFLKFDSLFILKS